MPGRTRLALIVDKLSVTQWQAEALLQIADEAEFILVNCTNTELRRRPFRHALYYVLNIVSLKSPATKYVPLPAGLTVVERIDFEAERDGSWQRLPANVVDILSKRRPEVALKFGMGLLRVPEQLECKILSYHHGDPRHFRGRPAGFYELLTGVPTVGQIVQIISNRLDAGAVVAFGETRVQPHSYRATMAESYRVSPLLMKAALRNCVAGKTLPIDPVGRNYRLPSNWTVLRLGSKLIIAKAQRLLYGAFFEKGWEVASARVDTSTVGELIEGIRAPGTWHVVERPAKYRFLADPFPHPRDGVIVEALRRQDGQGEIVHFTERADKVLCAGTGHFSYPATVTVDGQWFMAPEVAEWTHPRLYRLTDDGCEFSGEVDIEGRPRLVDATLHSAHGRIYLFANDLSEGSEVLRLWTAESLASTFVEHPESPILVSPRGGRMGGSLLEIGGRIYRPGQDCARGYGSRILLFEVTALSTSSYEERLAFELSLDGVVGPHTLNLRGSTAFFDFYRDCFSLFAGVRRFRAAIAKRSALAAQRNLDQE